MYFQLVVHLLMNIHLKNHCLYSSKNL